MYGAILGDIIGSRFEFDNGGWTKDFELLTYESKWTDDTVMTIAIAEALMNAGKDATVSEIEAACIKSMQKWGQKYPYAGYGNRFIHWVSSKNPKPYNSYGNGSAMRVSPVGWVYDSLERTSEVARATANVSHNHPEGIKGAECTAAVMYLARTGATKEEIADYVVKEFGYDFSETMEEMRARHKHDESCQDALPKALRSFFDGESYEDVVRNAVSLGGDTDTIAAIAGAMGEAFFGMPFELKEMCLKNVKPDMFDIIRKFDRFISKEVDESREEYIDNAPLDAALLLFLEEEDEKKRKDSFITFLNIMAKRISEDGMVPMPFVDVNNTLNKELEKVLFPEGENDQTEKPDKEKVGDNGEQTMVLDKTKQVPELDIEQIRARLEKCDTIHCEEEVRLRMDTMMDGEGGLWLPLFLNNRELSKGQTANITMPVPIMDVLKFGLHGEDLKGVVINPFGKAFTMPKELLKKFIDDYEAWAATNKPSP